MNSDSAVTSVTSVIYVNKNGLYCHTIVVIKRNQRQGNKTETTEVNEIATKKKKKKPGSKKNQDSEEESAAATPCLKLPPVKWKRLTLGLSPITSLNGEEMQCIMGSPLLPPNFVTEQNFDSNIHSDFQNH